MVLKYIFIVAFLYFFAYSLGFPIMIFTRSEFTKKYHYVIFPMIGISIGMIIMYYLCCLGFSVEQEAWWLTGFFVSVGIVLLVFNKVYERDIIGSFARVGIIIVITVFVLSLPGIMFVDGDFSISLGNNDFVLYTITSNAVKYYGGEKFVNHAGYAATWINGYQNRYIDFWIAYISCIFNVSIFSATTIIEMFSYALVAISSIPLIDSIKTVLSKKRKALLIVILLLNCNLLYIYLEGFVAQIVSIAYMVLLTGVMVELIKLHYFNNSARKESIIAGVLLSGLGSTYGEMLPIICVPLLMILLYYFFSNRSIAFKILKDYILMILTIVVIFPRMFYTAVEMMKVSNAATVGWDIVPGFLLQSLGLYNTFLYGYIGFKIPEMVALSFSIVILLVLVFYVIKNYENYIVPIICTFIISYFILYMFFWIRYDLYKTFKAMMNMYYIFVVVYFAMLLQNSENENKWIIRLKKIVLLFSTLLVVCNFMVMYGRYASAAEAIDDDSRITNNYIDDNYHEVEKYISVVDCDDIYVCGFPYWDNLAAVTMALSNREAEIQNLNGVIIDNHTEEIPSQEDIIMDSSTFPEPLLYGGEVLKENNVYTIKKVDLSFPYCTNILDVGELRITGVQDGQFVGGRIVLNDNQNIDDVKLNFFVEEKRKLDIGIRLMSSKESLIEITTTDGKTKSVYLNEGLNEVNIEEVSYNKGSDNYMRIKDLADTNGDVFINDLYYDNYRNDRSLVKEGNQSLIYQCIRSVYDATNKLLKKNEYKWGETLDFTNKTQTAKKNDEIVKFGFSGYEDEGTWLDGKNAELLFELSEEIKTGEKLKCHIKYARTNGKQSVIIKANDDLAINESVEGTGELVFDIICPEEHDVKLDFCVPNAVSPLSLHYSNDPRQLSIMISSINIEKAE